MINRTKLECAALCQADQGCDFFKYHKQSGSCEMAAKGCTEMPEQSESTGMPVYSKVSSKYADQDIKVTN